MIDLVINNKRFSQEEKDFIFLLNCQVEDELYIYRSRAFDKLYAVVGFISVRCFGTEDTELFQYTLKKVIAYCSERKRCELCEGIK